MGKRLIDENPLCSSGKITEDDKGRFPPILMSVGKDGNMHELYADSLSDC
jgi:hypothetical protein